MPRFAYEKKLGSIQLEQPKEIVARLIQYHDEESKSLDLRLYINGDLNRYTKAGLTIPVGLLPAFFDFIEELKTSLNETILKGVSDNNGKAGFRCSS
jgi:hypothetical protein